MAFARRSGFAGWDHTMEGGLGLGDYPKGFPGHAGPWTTAQLTALGENWHYDDVTGLLTNAMPVDPVSMGMAWDNDTGAYQTIQFFNDRAAASLAATASAYTGNFVPAFPMCGPNLPTGTMCDPGYGDHAIPNPPYPAGSVKAAGGMIPTQGFPQTKVPLVTAPVIPEQTPFDRVTGAVPQPTDVMIPPGAGHELSVVNGGGMPMPIPTADTQAVAPAGVSGFGGTAMLALLGLVGAVWVMSKEQRR